jgi:hypothetical protein
LKLTVPRLREGYVLRRRKRRSMLAHGNALGYKCNQLSRPESAQESSALSERTMIAVLRTRGVAPGWYPPRRWHGNICELGSTGSQEKSIVGNTFAFSLIFRRENPAGIQFRPFSAMLALLRRWH